MIYRVVTTCNADGWEKYGRRMAATFVKHWPTDIRLTVYAEGFLPDVPGVDIESLPKWQRDFKDRHSGVKSRIGAVGAVYNYRFDAVRFSHKVGAITHAAKTKQGVLIWMDADMVTHARVTHEWLAEIYPRQTYMAWLDRTRLYPECGFLLFDAEHPAHAELMRRFEMIYISGAVFGLQETHDSFVLEHLVQSAIAEGWMDQPHSLSGDAREFHHPLVRGRLGECFDHLKGERKERGRSSTKDTGRQRPEAYWR